MYFSTIKRKIKTLLRTVDRKKVIFLTILFFISVVVGINDVFEKKEIVVPKATSIDSKALEIEEIVNAGDISAREKIYIKLIERVGPEQAQIELKNSGLPFDGQSHLLNHTVGNFLYQKYGPAGITKCKDYFSSSCYHGIIINTLSDGEMDSVDSMLDLCKEKGEGFLDNCVHGMGHGFLPWVGYANLTEALVLCDSLSERVAGIAVDACYTGVFMENIWGVHEGTPSPDRWIKKDDKHHPCSDPRIAEHYRGACWQQQNTIMYDVFKLTHKQIAKECMALAVNRLQHNCFVGLFQSIHGYSGNNVDIQFNECSKMPPTWVRSCLMSQVDFGVGQGDDVTPFEVCMRMHDEDKGQCYKNLNKYIDRSVLPDAKRSWCLKMPAQRREAECRTSKEF